MAATAPSRALRPAIVGMLAGTLAVAAQLQLPIPPVPITLHTVVTGLIGLVLPPGEAAACVLVYLTLGAMGLPVFAGFKGGLGVLAGPTGGFLLGFLVQVVLTSVLYRRRTSLGFWHLFWVQLPGVLALFAVGGVFLVGRHLDDAGRLVGILAPLVPGAALKMWLTALLYQALGPRLPPPYRSNGAGHAAR